MRHEVTGLELVDIKAAHSGTSIKLTAKLTGHWQGDAPKHCSSERRTDLTGVTLKVFETVFSAEKCSCAVNHNTGDVTIQAWTTHRIRDIRGQELELARRAAQADWSALSSIYAKSLLDVEEFEPEIELAWSTASSPEDEEE